MKHRKKMFVYIILLILVLIAVPLLSGIQKVGLNLALRVFLITAAIYIILEMMQPANRK